MSLYFVRQQGASFGTPNLLQAHGSGDIGIGLKCLILKGAKRIEQFVERVGLNQAPQNEHEQSDRNNSADGAPFPLRRFSVWLVSRHASAIHPAADYRHPPNRAARILPQASGCWQPNHLAHRSVVLLRLAHDSTGQTNAFSRDTRIAN
jgi:hypothetical protein